MEPNFIRFAYFVIVYSQRGYCSNSQHCCVFKATVTVMIIEMGIDFSFQMIGLFLQFPHHCLIGHVSRPYGFLDIYAPPDSTVLNYDPYY